ncbi:MAG: MBL fold metallo-hydrolase [Defluviitoga tunisiensis]|uniref:Beta-lactamase n=1 Tax=Defluviitoga tunisiensis TaxID=1006576 RepID=A0A0C7P3R2_DEFTU|nr:MBL fold metallo-hydrolase [Defluviitoga tunisiensis]MDD3601121.1 MBL fold metallo-hydrolase [Defluviitoga tunisiensis]MDY0379768.1 MBL fold metallo-hydrolase [Defluviitoga tunisiensis]CEP78519.1 beta-lactamase [Defluviitoga tunisiensis]HHV00874.1 MBL fold metallo-hydrolase [Defluviitoga tunisiensis]HOB55632.1 MBL fold metallo-hydrolase [Defluviitoga tunisiensis]
MEIQKLVTSKGFQTNTYIINNEIIIDPGEGVGQFVSKDHEFIVLLTHGHFDHILGLSEIKVKELYVHPLDVNLLQNPKENLSFLLDKPFSWLKPWKNISENYRVIHTPGHTPGSCVIHIGDYLFTGDTLFFDSIGRTDLPNSSTDDMKNSLKILKQYFKSLPRNTFIAPGHMRTGTLEEVLENNPFLKEI